MSLHPVTDAEELQAALDSAPIEMLIGALVRRAGRLCALAEAAYHESTARGTTPDRAKELSRSAAASALRARTIADAIFLLAPGTPQETEAAGYARFAGTYDRMLVWRQEMVKPEHEGEARRG